MFEILVLVSWLWFGIDGELADGASEGWMSE